MWDAAPGEECRRDDDVCHSRLCRRLPMLRRLRGQYSAVAMHGRREVDAGVHQLHAYVTTDHFLLYVVMNIRSLIRKLAVYARLFPRA